jgi:hypothetical protein
MRLGVVLPPLGVGKRLLLRLLLRGGRLLVGSLYMLGEEEEIFFAPRNPLGPLGGRDVVGSNRLLVVPGVLVCGRALACTYTHRNCIGTA